MKDDFPYTWKQMTKAIKEQLKKTPPPEIINLKVEIPGQTKRYIRSVRWFDDLTVTHKHKWQESDDQIEWTDIK